MLGLGYMMNAGYDPLALVSEFERWHTKFAPDEGLKAKALTLTSVAKISVLNTSTFDKSLVPRRIGVIAFAAQQQTRAFGIRAALGATRRDRKLVTGDALTTALAGAGLWMAVAFVARCVPAYRATRVEA